MEILRKWSLTEDLSIAQVHRFPDELYRSQLEQYILSQSPHLAWKEKLNQTESEKIKALGKNLNEATKFRIALLDGNKLVGWSFGWQITSDSYFMAASMVLPTYRNKGFYSELVKKVMLVTKEAGFQSLLSSHTLTNNPVIIAKLKLGFMIKGIELDATHGPLLNLVFYHNELLKSAAQFRSGATGESKVRKMLVE